MKTALKLISLTLLVFSIGVTSNHAQSESEPIEESSPIPPRLVEMGEGSPHPFALIKTLDPENGFVVFDWVSSEGAKLDGGNSIARFAPLTADMETGEFATLTDAEIKTSILAPDEPQDFAQTLEIVISRLTETELNALLDSTNANVRRFLEIARIRGRIRSTNTDFIGARALLDALGIITSARWTETVNALPPILSP